MRAHGPGKAPEAPLATLAKIKSAQRLVAVDRKAQALGLKPGMTLTDARARHPSLVTFDADARAEAETLSHIADWCRRFTPLAALDAPEGIILDVSGAAHLFGGETKLLTEIEAQLEAQGFHARAALAPTPEAAWALARFGTRQILPEDEKERRRVLGELPLAALRLDEKTIADLAQAGLRRIGDILLRPRAPIAARFGSTLHARLDALQGLTKSAISPRFEAPAYVAERRFLDCIMRREDIEATIASLAQDLALMLTRHGEGARRLEVNLFRVDGMVKHIETGTSRPLRDPQAIARLFRERIEAIGQTDETDPLDAGFGFDVIRLAALTVERKDQEQTGWDTSSCVNETADLAALIDRLGARLGLRRVTRLAFNDTHIPEFAVAAMPAAEGNRTSRAYHLQQPASNNFEANSNGVEKGLAQRPIRLLQHPEPIETIASVPDGPPLRFRWRRVMHEVTAIEGPERIAPEWWKNETALTRDYFRAEDSEGQRFWLFREGLFNRETARPRWFMHGFFA
jgi:protein ImuB